MKIAAAMSPQAQRIAIAEACGFSGEFGKRWILETGMEGEDEFVFAATRNHLDEEVPDYLNDLNAMHEAEETLSANQRIDFACYLTEPVRDQIYNVMPYDLHYPVCFPAIHTTARQRAEAFLRTIGKWEE
jgi:hypothetical protein